MQAGGGPTRYVLKASMLKRDDGEICAVAFTQNQAGDVLSGEVMHSLGTNSNAIGRNATNVAIPVSANQRGEVLA